jgi:hypothetical protein
MTVKRGPSPRTRLRNAARAIAERATEAEGLARTEGLEHHVAPFRLLARLAEILDTEIGKTGPQPLRRAAGARRNAAIRRL